MTYTFTSIAGGTAKFKSSGGYHIPSTKPEMYENPDSVIFRADTTQYVIYPATDTIIINGTTNAPGSLSVTQLSDALNVLFPKATTTGGGNGSATTDASQLISGTLPDGRLSGNVSLALKPTAIKTTAYTAAAGELVKVDATAANIPITLPTAPVDKTRIAVKMIAVSGSNVATITTGGTDVFNKSGGVTSATLTLLNQAVTLQYESAIGVWSVISSDMPLSQLDTRFSDASRLSSGKLSNNILREQIDVFVIAGQSNAVGNSADPQNSPVIDAGYAYQFYNGVLFALSNPVGNATGGGPWLSYAERYHQLTGRKILLVPTAYGATSVTVAGDTGNGNWSETGTLFQASVTKTNAALALATTQGYTPILKGIIWAQGENDYNVPVADYKTATLSVISRYISSFGNRVPFYMIRTGEYGNTGTYSGIRQAQEDLADTTPNVYIVSRLASRFNFLGLMQGDSVHYTQAGYNQIGTDTAEHIFSLKTFYPTKNSSSGILKQILYSHVQIVNPASTTVENTVYTGIIPANSIGINGTFQFYFLFTCTNNANTKTLRIRINNTIVATAFQTTVAVYRGLTIISNRNSSVVQIGGNSSGGTSISLGGSSTGISTFSFPTDRDLTVTVTLQTAVATDSMALEDFQLVAVQ